MKIKPLYLLYQFLVAYPIIGLITLIVALLTMLLSPLFPNSYLSYFPARWWGRTICRLLFVKVQLKGTQHLDTNLSYVIVANHQSIFDIFAIYGWLPHIFKWVMKSELKHIPFVGQACAAAGHIFIERSNPVIASKSLEEARKKIQKGVSVVVFPEGTRTYTGEVGKFKKGAFRLAADLSLPILPVTIQGSLHCLKRNTCIVSPGTITITFHPPVEVKPYLPDRWNELMDYTRAVITLTNQPTSPAELNH